MVINRRLRINDSFCVYSDQHMASQMAVRYLMEQGHRNIAFITGSLDSPTSQERLSGYQTALREQGIAINQQLIVHGKWTAQSGMLAVKTLLARGQSFSAIVASNDEMAIGAIKQLTENNIAVPGTVSVIGFDDIPLAPYIIPALSSVKFPVTDMINETINRLVSMLDGGELTTLTPFKGSLVLRDSITVAP
jgi:LacI family asc operon transcriptional repressor